MQIKNTHEIIFSLHAIENDPLAVLSSPDCSGGLLNSFVYLEMSFHQHVIFHSDNVLYT